MCFILDLLLRALLVGYWLMGLRGWMGWDGLGVGVSRKGPEHVRTGQRLT